MEQFVIAVHILVAIAIIALILLQQGKGAEMGASFGGGSSQTLFGSQGSGNFLSHTTAILVTVFFVTSVALSLLAKHQSATGTEIGVPAAEVIESHNKKAETKTPAPAGDAPAIESSKQETNDAPAMPAESKSTASPEKPAQPKLEAKTPLTEKKP